MQYKAVIFDLDGTLINTLDDLGDAVNFMLAGYGYPTFPIDDYKMMVGNGMRKLIERAMPPEHQEKAEIDAALAIFMERYNAHALDKTHAYQGVPEAVKAVSDLGLKTAVCTNKAEASAKLILEKLYPGCFDFILGQRENLPTKPDPAGVLLVMKELGVTPAECVFVGDSGVDIQTAVNAGAFPVGVLWGFRDEKELRDNGAKEIISDPADLVSFLQDSK